MIILDRSLFGFIQYRKVFFPGDEIADQLAKPLAANQIMRIFCASVGAPDASLQNRYLIRATRMWTTCVDMSQDTQAVLKMMSRRTRERIRQVDKMQDHLSIESNTERVTSDFLDLYTSLSRAKSSVPRLSERSLAHYAAVSDVFVLYLEGRPMCGHVLLPDPAAGRVRLLFSASRRLEDTVEANLCGNLNRYLHWHEMKTYAERGLPLYDFGGFCHSEWNKGETDPIDRFKLSFGSIVMEDHYYELIGSRWLGWLALRLHNNLLSASGRNVVRALAKA